MAPFAFPNIIASGGVAPYVYILSAGVLPVGITFLSTGFFSGNSIQAGNFPIEVTAIDSNGCQSVQQYILQNNPPPN